MEKQKSLAQTQRDAFLQDGYCRFEKIINQTMIDELAQVAEKLFADYSPEDKERHRYQGSSIGIRCQSPLFPRLFSWPAALDALRTLGIKHPKFWIGVLLCKPPHSPPLYWHQDWWAWDDPASAGAMPPQIFLMYYLTDTSPQNGCLRVIPGTHRRRIPFHDALPTAHVETTLRASVDSPLFANPVEAVDVPVKAGDVVIGDARVLHAAYANQTESPRTCLTIMYFPEYEQLSEPTRASIAASVAGQPPMPPEMEPLLPVYHGAAEPCPWNRVPGKYLRTETEEQTQRACV
jgi:hypothetical protein